MNYKTSYFKVLFRQTCRHLAGLLLSLVISLTSGEMVFAGTIESFDQIQSESVLARLSDTQLRELLVTRQSEPANPSDKNDSNTNVAGGAALAATQGKEPPPQPA